MTAKKRDILLTVLCGVPASGKSHLSRLICDKYAKESPRTCATVAVCYDRLIPEQQLITKSDVLAATTSSNSSPWKQYRDNIVKAVDVLVADMVKLVSPHEANRDAGSGSVTDHEEKTSSISRLIEDTLRKENDLQLLVGTLSHRNELQRVLFIIDDNMYFKSMRYDYYRLARKYNIGFCQIHVQCDVETALRRNQSRLDDGVGAAAAPSAVIDDNVIRTMYDKLEVPERSWEAMSLALDNNLDDNFQSCWSSLDDFLSVAFTCRVQRLGDGDSQEQRDLSRLACRRSVLHQVDRELRSLISKAAKQDSSNSRIDRLNAARREIMDNIKKGVIDFQDDQRREIDGGVSEELSHFLEGKLNDKIQ